MTALPDDWTPPPRSILYVETAPPTEGGGVVVGCDCGTVTHLIIADADKLTVTVDASFTCDGCGSVHWFTVGPAAEGGEP